MKKEKNNALYANAYYNKMHRIGTWILVFAIVMFFMIPTIICLYYGIMPKLGDLLIAAGGLCAVFIPVGIAESFAEIPVMGSSYYISLVTGNVLNLKLPAAINALKVADLKQGTEKADAVAGLAVAVSSVVTLIMLLLGVLLLVPLTPLLSSPVVSTASSYVLPSLFGCMCLSFISDDVGGGVKVHHRLRACFVPFIGCIVLYLLMPDLYGGLEGIIMMICIPVVYLFTKSMYKKGKITVDMPAPETAQEGGEDGAGQLEAASDDKA